MWYVWKGDVQPGGNTNPSVLILDQDTQAPFSNIPFHLVLCHRKMLPTSIPVLFLRFGTQLNFLVEVKLITMARQWGLGHLLMQIDVRNISATLLTLGFLFRRVTVTKPPLRTSWTALRRPIRFLLRRPNRHQDRRSLRHSFPENLITCIVTLIPHVTHHVQSSRDSRLSRFHKVSELLSQPPPVSIRKTYSHTHNSRTAQ